MCSSSPLLKPLYVVLFSNLMSLFFVFFFFKVGDRTSGRRGGGGGGIGSACIIRLGSVAQCATGGCLV